jgi:hypothetical protein
MTPPRPLSTRLVVHSAMGSVARRAGRRRAEAGQRARPRGSTESPAAGGGGRLFLRQKAASRPTAAVPPPALQHMTGVQGSHPHTARQAEPGLARQRIGQRVGQALDHPRPVGQAPAEVGPAAGTAGTDHSLPQVVVRARDQAAHLAGVAHRQRRSVRRLQAQFLPATHWPAKPRVRRRRNPSWHHTTHSTGPSPARASAGSAPAGPPSSVHPPQ